MFTSPDQTTKVQQAFGETVTPTTPFKVGDHGLLQTFSQGAWHDSEAHTTAFIRFITQRYGWADKMVSAWLSQNRELFSEHHDTAIHWLRRFEEQKANFETAQEIEASRAKKPEKEEKAGTAGQKAVIGALAALAAGSAIHSVLTLPEKQTQPAAQTATATPATLADYPDRLFELKDGLLVAKVDLNDKLAVLKTLGKLPGDLDPKSVIYQVALQFPGERSPRFIDVVNDNFANPLTMINDALSGKYVGKEHKYASPMSVQDALREYRRRSGEITR